MINFNNVQFKQGGKYHFSEEQEKEIVRLYVEGFSLIKLCALTGIKSPETVRRIIRKHGVKINGFRYQFPLKEDYFVEINSADKAYWLGVLYADGNLTEKTKEVRLGLIDKEHIEKFKNAIGATKHKIGKVEDVRFNSLSTYYYLGVKSQLMYESLTKLGCIPNKSLVLSSIPDIPDELVSHFIRGYFDGDGSIHKANIKQWRVSFTGTYLFLKDIQKRLRVNTKIAKGSNRAKDFNFQISGKYQLKRVLDYLYLNSSENNRLNRKYEHYLTFVQEMGASLSNL